MLPIQLDINCQWRELRLSIEGRVCFATARPDVNPRPPLLVRHL